MRTDTFTAPGQDTADRMGRLITAIRLAHDTSSASNEEKERVQTLLWFASKAAKARRNGSVLIAYLLERLTIRACKVFVEEFLAVPA